MAGVAVKLQEHTEVLISAIVGTVFFVACMWLLMMLGQLPDLPEFGASEATRDQFGRREN